MSALSGPATTSEDARVVIEALARLKGCFTDAFRREAEEEEENGRPGMLQAIKGGEEIRKDLANSLTSISTNMYTNRARFLMELIQNADDNNYTEVTPTVSITVFPRLVKIECNEEGFSRENIQALCRVGQSSKKPGQGYTGEKGIGFKSVFKLARRAHVRSSPYYFQLDQARELGMITPQWDEDFFKDHKEEYQTTIILDRICDESTNFSTALEEDIEAIDPILILFLRRIERLHLTLFRPSYSEPAISKHFRRVDWTPDSGIVSLKDEDANMTRRLYKHRFQTHFRGTEERRPDITVTDIVLAFPVMKESDSYKPDIRKQNFVFAYLPLGDFGFKFVIQADFLAISNRQSVDEDNNWNRNIAAAIPHAFEAAIGKFNSNGGNSELDELARSWPLYLNNHAGGLSAYWRRITKGITKHLTGTPVIKDQQDRFEKPNRLMFLDWAHDRNGLPMFGSMSDYVSSDYPESVREPLLSLGITAPTWKWVSDKLQELHDGGLLLTKMQSKEWCSDLAKVILAPQAPRGDRTYASDLGRIPLIPLADGTWKCPPSGDENFYFPASLGTTIPPGLPLNLVDEDACTCPKRVRLFRLLGVQDCDVPNVVERILEYHDELSSATGVHVIAQIKYLYKMREHLVPGDMKKVSFACSKKSLKKGTSIYADISVGGELRQIFSGYSKAHFLSNSYFVGLDPFEKSKFAEWLCETASVALAPRFISGNSSLMHRDFVWLRYNKPDQLLDILRQHWSLYKKIITSSVKQRLAYQGFACKSGVLVELCNTYIPLPSLVEKVQTFGNAGRCNFLALPSGDPNEWKFLSSFGVGVDEGLDFYLWVLKQPGFIEHIDVDKSKELYLTIQSEAFYPSEKEKVRKAFGSAIINLPNKKFRYLTSCVWHGPKGLSSKRVLHSVYGYKLERLFRKILNVPNATSSEAREYLEQLRNNATTTMGEVAEVYVFLQKYRADTFTFDENTPIIAVPSSSGSDLDWKTPAECVWDDDEFSQNGLVLESKTAIRRTIEQHAPTTKAFFTDILDIRNAGIHELLDDLELMERKKRDDPNRVYRLYERIESCRRACPEMIREAFEEHPLVFLRDINNQSGRWLSLDQCIWTRSALWYKHALMPSLDQYRDLFRYTLGVSNATIDMLVDELLRVALSSRSEDGYRHAKELLPEIARMHRDDNEMEDLDGERCWPCRTSSYWRKFCSIGSFYVNDREDLFEIFSNTHTFLDFDFDTSRNLENILRNGGCDMFLSENVLIETESRKPLEYAHDLTQDFRGRADALVKYFEHAGCDSPYELRRLLENVEVWMSADIRTKYKLESTTITKREGGSSVKVSTKYGKSAKLEIFVSTNRHKCSCALITDFPKQLVEALELEPDGLPDLLPLLQVPLVSLKAFLVRKGITGRDAADDDEETIVADSAVGSTSRTDGSSDDSGDNTSTTSANRTSSDSVAPNVAEFAHASARSEAANPTLRPHTEHRPSSRSTTPEPRSRDHPNLSSNESPHERPVTPLPTAAGPYSTDNRNRNRERLQGFAQNANPASSSRPERPSGQSGSGDGAFDVSALREALGTVEPTPVSTPVQFNPSPRRRGRLIPNRNEVEMARDFEVGFLGEQFVYTLLHDTLRLPNFTGEDNWTSSLRTGAGFSGFGREVSDFTYKDTQGTLTRHFLQMQHPYATPAWLSTVCDNGNEPLYRLEVKSTTSQDPATTFYMSSAQHKLAKRLCVTSATPYEVYVILRVSGLDALEDGAQHRPQWRVYLDPYTRGEEGILNFIAPTYAVTTTV